MPKKERQKPGRIDRFGFFDGRRDFITRSKISPDRIIRELKAIGFAKATDYLCIRDNELLLKPSDSLSRADQAAIASVERTSNGIRLKFYDKMKALELLGKAAGMFDGNPEVEENNLLEAILQATGGEMDTDDIPEIQQTADAGHDLVEPAGPAKP